MTARVLYIEFKKTEIGPALNKVCQRAFALQLQKQGPRPRSAIKANGHTTAASSSSAAATDASTASSSSTALARDKKGAPLTAQQVMSAIEAQFAVASSSTAASIVSADTPLSSSLTRSRRLSCDDIILKTSGRASNSALQELKANIAAAAIASGVPNIQSTSSASSTESLDRTSEPLAAPHLSLSPRTNTPHVTPPIATSSSAPVQPVSTSSSSSTSNIASKLVVPQDLERDPAKIKERERVRRKLKRGLKSKLRASHCYVPPTPELIASVTIAPPARNIEPGNFPDPGTRQLSIALARLSCISLSYLVSRISYLVSRISYLHSLPSRFHRHLGGGGGARFLARPSLRQRASALGDRDDQQQQKERRFPLLVSFFSVFVAAATRRSIICLSIYIYRSPVSLACWRAFRKYDLSLRALYCVKWQRFRAS